MTTSRPTAITVSELLKEEPRDLGPSGWHRIAQDRVNQFASATGDNQWIHVDPVRAATGPFGTTIAHGYLILAMVPSMMLELLDITDEDSGVNYGLERVRFTAPVRVEDRIRLNATILPGDDHGTGGVRFEVDLRVDVEGQERPAMIARAVFLSLR